MKTSLGIWALGPMITRFVPGGYQPEYTNEPMPVKVRRAVDGLGDLMDAYEFHYPGELNPDNLDAVRDALDGHPIATVCTGLHTDERFGRGGLTAPDAAVRAEARRLTRETAELAGTVGANMICWPGIEGYNYPFQTQYAQAWEWFIDGMAEAAEICAKHGVKLFLEHKNSEPAMKIFMRNIGMTLHVIHKLKERGITNVQVNMDWQHLIMNGESLGEYAAMLAAEGLLGHQHANSGWGTFDDDNMVGATAFMETLELALELRRANYGANGEYLGFDLYPYTEDAVAAVKRSVLQWNFIDGVAAKIDERGAARGAADQERRPGVRARVRGARRDRVTTRSLRDPARAQVSRATRARARPAMRAAAAATSRSRSCVTAGGSHDCGQNRIPPVSDPRMTSPGTIDLCAGSQNTTSLRRTVGYATTPPGSSVSPRKVASTRPARRSIAARAPETACTCASYRSTIRAALRVCQNTVTST